MRWDYFPLAPDDPKAKKHILRNLEMGAYEHTLSRRLLLRFAEASGPFLLIAFESVDLDADCLYEYATYCGGQGQLPDSDSISWMDSPRWGLIPFVDRHLLKSKEAIVLCENVFAARRDVLDYPWESRVLFFGDEVYHILTSENAASADSIECALRESEYHWSTGVCSSSGMIPDGDIPSEAFFDTIVANTVHIFVPALDGEGYLVWSPVT